MTLSEKEIQEIQEKQELSNLKSYIKLFRHIIYYGTLILLVILFLSYSNWLLVI